MWGDTIVFRPWDVAVGLDPAEELPPELGSKEWKL